MPVNISSKEAFARKSSRFQNQWKPRETGSRENQRRQGMMKILSHILRSHGPWNPQNTDPLSHPYTAKLSTTLESSNLANIHHSLKSWCAGKDYLTGS